MIFVTTTRKFNNVFRNIQKNALNSWNRLDVEKTIIVLTKDLETKEFCRQNHFVVIYEFECSPTTGIPTFRSLYNAGKFFAKENESICLINADIILDDDFTSTYKSFRASFPSQEQYLLVGQRMDANFDNMLLDFTTSNWRESLPVGSLHPGCGIDYFLTSKTTFSDLPDFYISRFSYDGWLISNANSRPDVFLADCTMTIKCYHQNHEYGDEGNVKDEDWVKHPTIADDVEKNSRYPHTLNIEKISIKSINTGEKNVNFTK